MLHVDAAAVWPAAPMSLNQRVLRETGQLMDNNASGVFLKVFQSVFYMVFPYPFPMY